MSRQRLNPGRGLATTHRRISNDVVSATAGRAPDLLVRKRHICERGVCCSGPLGWVRWLAKNLRRGYVNPVPRARILLARCPRPHARGRWHRWRTLGAGNGGGCPKTAKIVLYKTAKTPESFVQNRQSITFLICRCQGGSSPLNGSAETWPSGRRRSPAKRADFTGKSLKYKTFPIFLCGIPKSCPSCPKVPTKGQQSVRKIVGYLLSIVPRHISAGPAATVDQ
jgi:hypothetical protein